MKLHFESDLPYQIDAIEAVCDLFRGQEMCRSVFTVTAQALGADVFTGVAPGSAAARGTTGLPSGGTLRSGIFVGLWRSATSLPGAGPVARVSSFRRTFISQNGVVAPSAVSTTSSRSSRKIMRWV